MSQSKFQSKLLILSLGIAIILAIIEALVIQGWLNPQRIVNLDEPSVLVRSADNFTHASYLALKASQPPPSGTLHIYVIGGSSMRECFFEDKAMKRLIDKAMGRPVEFVNLSTFDQNIVESLILASNVWLGPNTLLILGLNPRLVSATGNGGAGYSCGGRLPFIVEQASAQLASIGVVRCGWWVPRLFTERSYISRYLDNRLGFPFFRKLALYLQDKKPFPKFSDFVRFNRVEFYLAHPFPDTVMPMARKKQIAFRIGSTRLEEYRQNHKYSFKVLRLILDQARAKGATVVAVQAPRSQISVEAYGPIMAGYRTLLTQHLTAVGVPYIPFPGAPQYQGRDFYDLDHLNSKGRQKYAPWFAEKLAAVVGR